MAKQGGFSVGIGRQWRKIRASWRDTLLLFRQFAWPLFYFSLAVVGGGLLYFWLSNRAGQPINSWAESIYLVLGLTFLQPPGEFPVDWYLQIFFFLMPVIGIAILARGLADFGRLLFNRQARSKEWEMAVASTFKDHIVLIGLGHLGFRVAQKLNDLDQEVVVVELDPEADLIVTAQKMDIPVIRDDGKREEALIGAGISKARTIAVCTQNDNLNLQIAFKARKLNPNVNVVIRIFDTNFANTLEEQFGFLALSATNVAAPNFAAAAIGIDITRPITIEGQSLSLARLDILPRSGLAGCTVAEVEQNYEVSVVLLRHDAEPDFHPAGDRLVAANDVLAVLAGPEQVGRLIKDNKRR